MLTAVVLHLRPVAEVSLPRSHGSFVYNAVKDLLIREAPKLGDALYKEEERKPFTCSPLLGMEEGDRENWLLKPDKLYTLRLTGLTSEISQYLLSLWPEVHGIRIQNAVFSVEGLSATAEEHPEAGQITYKELLARWEKREPPRLLTLHFLTPTTFKVGAFEEPFPLPQWVFGSLLSTWNAFSPYPFFDIQEALEAVLVLRNWRGETRLVELGGYSAAGFVGKFTYRLIRASPVIARICGLLAEFSFYAGVGWQTTHGLGQVRPEFPRNTRSR
jgi:CRISPR-associated endoribonuclease Cas6